jgi:hypothetical protein
MGHISTYIFSAETYFLLYILLADRPVTLKPLKMGELLGPVLLKIFWKYSAFHEVQK